MKKILLVALLFASSCEKSTLTDTDHESSTVRKFVQGRVTDTKGGPIPGARIIVDNTIYYNSGITGTTDGNGFYKIPVEKGSWRVYAEIDRTFNGKHFKKLELHPDKDNSFAGADGATVNFQWLLAGEKPAPLVGFYGGTVYLYSDPESGIRDSENIEFTFTPDGNLIDGDPGSIIVRKGGQPFTSTYSQVPDIPIGKYKVTAKHVPTGKPLRLRKTYPDDYTPVLAVEFEPEFTFCDRCLTINFTD